MSLSNVYIKVHRGAMTVIGNTAMVNRDAINWNPYVWMSTIPSNQVAGYLGNTVSTTSNAFSTSKLNIPSTCVVKFALLIWTGDGSSPNINFIPPDGVTLIIPSTTTYSYSTNNTQTADVSAIVQNNKSGNYTVGNYGAINSFCGWCMIVIYEDISLPFRYFNAYVGAGAVSSSTPLPLTFTDFITPNNGPVTGYITLAYMAGDLDDAAQFKVGPTIPNNILGNTSTTVWNGIAPYNKSTNMFPGLICFADCNDPTRIGLINSESTLSTRNINPYAGTYAVSGRALYDITGLNMSSTLQNSQTNLYTSIGFLGGGAALSILQAVQIDINSADIIPVKIVDKATAIPGDTLLYTMVLSNTGFLNADNVIVVDTLPNGVSFVAGSLNVNGVTVAGSVVPPGYAVGTIPFSSTTTITFVANVNTVPAVTTALNNSYYLSYNFTPVTISQSANGQSNIVTTTIPIASLSNITKSTSKSYADVGDFITYTITIPNTGQADAGDVIFIDTIPLGTNYIANSFLLNNTTIPGADPQSGVNIGTIAVSSIATISFTVQVATIPTINPIPNKGQTSYNSYGMIPVTDTSNIVETQVNNATIAMTKIANLAFADIGNTITYTVVLRNLGNVSATSITFTDTIPPDTTFIANSVTVDGTTVVGSPAPPSGILLGTINSAVVSTVTFAVVVNTVPSPNPIRNTGTTNYKYTVDPSFHNGVTAVANSNEVQTKVNHAGIILNKSESEGYVKCGSIIKYTIKIYNGGNSDAINIVVKDTIPNGTQFVPNSFTENGITLPGANPNNGVNISTISGGGTSTITFQVQVVC